ncbi:hypothetical protein QBC47DRAFT_390241 [Echria macrotheca]|uniref:Cyclochlorotine biosynthesis protein O n=1 Tax=Echria macrotheca TaxID=438768 RepID=A0AAJ0F6F6_9PEZI|nr:hypothetical protein QBC47DRAFT_390241 [Echria macrotheca]
MMPSRKKSVTYAPLDDEEKTQRPSSSSSSLERDRDSAGDAQGLPRPRWENPQSGLWWMLRRWSNFLWFHIILVLANLVLFGLAVYSNTGSGASHMHRIMRSGPHHGTSIFRDAVHLEERYFNVKSIYTFDGSLNRNKSNVVFSGPPRPELEEAWQDILAYQDFHVNADELGEFRGQKSLIELSDGSGYYMTVAFQHALHCVQRLHRYMYKEHYHNGLSEDDQFSLRQHTEHCLDWLRQYVQCNADTTLIPIRWAESIPGPVSKDWGKHQCVAWEPLREFLKSRSFNPRQPGLLVHPYFGDPYATDEHHAQTGAVVLGQGQGLIGGDHGPDV